VKGRRLTVQVIARLLAGVGNGCIKNCFSHYRRKESAGKQQDVNKAGWILEQRRCVRLGQNTERRALSQFSLHPISFAKYINQKTEGKCRPYGRNKKTGNVGIQ